jgi:hypothetical protein
MGPLVVVNAQVIANGTAGMADLKSASLLRRGEANVSLSVCALKTNDGQCSWTRVSVEMLDPRTAKAQDNCCKSPILHAMRHV